LNGGGDHEGLELGLISLRVGPVISYGAIRAGPPFLVFLLKKTKTKTNCSASARRKQPPPAFEWPHPLKECVCVCVEVLVKNSTFTVLKYHRANIYTKRYLNTFIS
jgi:hypothetical protein